MSPRSASLVVVIAVSLAGCTDRPNRTAAIGEAYVGPATLNIRTELGPTSPVATVVKHGQKLEIVQVRRRFIRVRTPAGLEGWTDSKQLLTAGQMDDLRELADRSAKLVPQGKAKVFSTLNMHAEPNRQSASFYQINERGVLEVLGHKVVPRATAAPATSTPLVPPPKPVVRAVKPKKKEEGRVPPVPMPPAPKLPDNWQQLSKTNLPGPTPAELAELEKRKQPVKLEDWSLVRTPDNKVGWVLTGGLNMAIPDEVAQYAEGHRITSYFPLGTVTDEGETKHHWLWTTQSRVNQPFEFDSFRVFSYNLRRHRYETTYIQRHVEGYYPVTLGKEDVLLNRKPVPTPAFAVILRDEGGSLERLRFVYEGYRVRLVSREPYTGAVGGIAATPDEGETTSEAPERPDQQPWYLRWKEKLLRKTRAGG